MNVVIFGAGAIGSYLAARLSHANVTVSIVARAPRLDQIRRHGILIEQNGAVERIRIAAIPDCRDVTPPDLVLLCCKAHDLSGAVEQLREHTTLHLGVVTLQNGVEAPEFVASALPRVQTIACRVHGFFEMCGDITRHVGVGPSIAFGALDTVAVEAEARLASCLRAAAIAHERPSDMRRALWEKFLLASAIGGVGAARDVPVGQLRLEPQHWAVLEAAMREIAAIGRAKGVDLAHDCVETTLDFIADFPEGATSSFQRDLSAGRRSEFNELTGAVLRMADQLNVPVPVHRDIVRQLTARGLV